MGALDAEKLTLERHLDELRHLLEQPQVCEKILDAVNISAWRAKMREGEPSRTHRYCL
jgi:hypothetical protein